MIRIAEVVTVVSIVLASASCGFEDESIMVDRSYDLERQVSVHATVDAAVIPGASLTLRANFGAPIEYQLQTSGLPPGVVASIWLCGFEQPLECMAAGDLGDGLNQCGVADRLDTQAHAQTGAFCKLAGSMISDGSGELTLDHFDDPAIPMMFGDPLSDVDGAELHFWVRTHGPPIPGRVDEQLTTWDGGCDVNTCVDLQIAVIPAES